MSSETDAAKALVVAAILVDDLDRPEHLLAARRCAPPALAGRWEFPGGKVESAEDPRWALRRELAEELQVQVTLGAELTGPAEGRWPISDTYEMRVWWAAVAGGSVAVNGSHDEFRWLSWRELSTVSWLAADLAVVEAVRARVAGPVRSPDATRSTQLTIVPSSYEHPDAVELTGLVQRYYRQVYGSVDRTPMQVDEFVPPNGRFLLGFLGAKAVAMGGWRRLGDGPPGVGRAAELKRMFVRPELRGLGLGVQMLRALERSAADAGADWMLLETGEPQTEAVALYRRSGYVDVPAFGFYAGEPGVLSIGRRLSRPPGRAEAASDTRGPAEHAP